MKDWIELEAQVEKHVARGLDLGTISASKFAMFLYSSNYYRVSGYGRCFYVPDEDRYQPGTTAAQLMDIYDLDRAVRNAVLDGVSVFEPTLRARVAYQVTKTVGGGDGYLQSNFYLPAGAESSSDEVKAKQYASEVKNRNKVLDALGAIQDRDELFTQHHRAKNDPVPLWAAVEVISIGTFSRLLRALRDKSVLAPVVASFHLEDESKFLQAVQNVTFLRNISAHHGRLWNRRFDGYVTLPGVALRVKRGYLHPKTPAAAFTLLAGLVDHIEGSDAYSTHLLDLVHSVRGMDAGYYSPIL